MNQIFHSIVKSYFTHNEKMALNLDIQKYCDERGIAVEQLSITTYNGYKTIEKWTNNQPPERYSIGIPMDGAYFITVPLNSEIIIMFCDKIFWRTVKTVIIKCNNEKSPLIYDD